MSWCLFGVVSKATFMLVVLDEFWMAVSLAKISGNSPDCGIGFSAFPDLRFHSREFIFYEKELGRR